MIVLRTILKKITSVFLIAVFAFSITPVRVLHNLFADHCDSVILHHHTKTNEVAKAGIDCHIENFVAERNFLAPYSRVVFNNVLYFSLLSDKYTSAFLSSYQLFTGLRGPPAIA